MKNGLKPGDKYLKGKIDLGVLGEHEVIFYPNQDKDKNENSPDFKSKHGALWVNKKKDTKEESVL